MFCIVIEEKATGKSLVEGEFETKEEAEAVLEERKTYYNTPIVLREMFGSYDAELDFQVEEIHHTIEVQMIERNPLRISRKGFFRLVRIIVFYGVHTNVESRFMSEAFA